MILDIHSYLLCGNKFLAGWSAVKKRISGTRKDQRGFTILELLVVLAIMGMLVGMVAPYAMRQLDSAKNRVAEQSIARISETLDIYKLDVGTYPTTDQGLEALIAAPAGVQGWDGPYLKPARLPLDPWGRPFHYRSPSQRQDHDFDIYSFGEKGQADGLEGSIKLINE